MEKQTWGGWQYEKKKEEDWNYEESKKNLKMQKRYDATILLLFFCGVGFWKARDALSNINNQQSYHSLQMLFIYGEVPSSLNLFTNKNSATGNSCSRY